MANRNNMESILKWSLSQSDGTRPTRQITEEERQWFSEALQSYTVDIVKRMKEITIVMNMSEEQLKNQGVTDDELEGMLEELQEHVESIDMANDLNSIGGLIPLLSFLTSSHANLRAKAAEVVSTVVQNNPKGQQNVLNAGGMALLLKTFTSDEDLTVRTKSLGAISSLIRHNRQALDAFRLGNGYLALKPALNSGDAKFQRKALNVLAYMMQESDVDRKAGIQSGLAPILIKLLSSEDMDVRHSSLRVLLQLAVKDSPEASALVSLPVKSNVGVSDSEPRTDSNQDFGLLKTTLKHRLEDMASLRREDLESLIEERHLLTELWQRCFGEDPLPLKNESALAEERDTPTDEAIHIQESSAYPHSLRSLLSEPLKLLGPTYQPHGESREENH